jgi:hypothetical protein
LRKALTGVGDSDGHGQRYQQTTDDQDCTSGKVQWSPDLFPIIAIPITLCTIRAGT